MSFFNYVFILLTLLFTACSNDKGIEHPQEEGNGRSTFVITSINGSAEVTKRDKYEMPIRKRFDFNVCMKDMLYRRTIINQKFAIYDGNKKISTDLSTEKGCFFWSEEISYNYLLPSKYIKLNRTIKSDGLHKGSLELTMAINPWRHNGEGSDVVNLNEVQITKISKQEYKDKKVSAPVYLENIKIVFPECFVHF